MQDKIRNNEVRINILKSKPENEEFEKMNVRAIRLEGDQPDSGFTDKILGYYRNLDNETTHLTDKIHKLENFQGALDKLEKTILDDKDGVVVKGKRGGNDIIDNYMVGPGQIQ